jgi:hypothetical protein
MIGLLSLLGCDDGTAPVDAPAPDPDAALVSLDPPRLLRRMSLDLRGVLPTVAELDAVEADPDAIAEVRDEFLADPRLEERLVDLFAERWYTEVDDYLIFYQEYQAFEGTSGLEYPWERAVGDEPLRLMAHVAVTDAPWSDIVTANYTMADELLAQVWPIAYPAGGTGWQVSTYTDGRPAAGVLATNGLWWRYYTTVSNYNRGRAAAIARLLLCVDYLSRPVSFTNNVAIVDEAGIEEALRTNPYCMGCHSSLDPMASSLFGFWVANEYNIFEMQTYHPEREPLGETLLGVAPAWYGAPIDGLAELGQEIAADPRFARCTAQSMAESLWRREVTVDDFDRVDALRQAYLDDGEELKPLLRAITDTAVYRAGGLGADATAAQVAGENTSRMIDARLLSSMLHDLTGFIWIWEGFEQLRNDTYGYRILGGAVDGAYVTRPQRTPGLTWSLTVQRAAEAAATFAVNHELATPGATNRLFHYADPDARPGDATFTRELTELDWRLSGRRPSAADQAGQEELWSAIEAGAGAEAAWVGLVSALLRDPDVVSY